MIRRLLLQCAVVVMALSAPQFASAQNSIPLYVGGEASCIDAIQLSERAYEADFSNCGDRYDAPRGMIHYFYCYKLQFIGDRQPSFYCQFASLSSNSKAGVNRVTFPKGGGRGAPGPLVYMSLAWNHEETSYADVRAACRAFATEHGYKSSQC